MKSAVLNLEWKATAIAVLLAIFDYASDFNPDVAQSLKDETEGKTSRLPEGFVAQNRLRSGSPLPLTDLPYGNSFGYAKSCEFVENCGADLDLRNLPLEVSCGEALT